MSDLDKTIRVLKNIIAFSEECFDDAKYQKDIRLKEQEEYKDATDLLRDLQIKKQKQQ